MTECGNDGYEDEDVLEDHVFLAELEKGNSSWGRKAKRTCPIKCGVGHTNGSLFFCSKFRKRSLRSGRHYKPSYIMYALLVRDGRQVTMCVV